MAKSKEKSARSELNFHEDAPRRDTVRSEFPAARARQAGVSSEDVTADDLSPETLLHEEGEDSLAGLGRTTANDLELTDVSEDDVGLGRGLDEAELADGKK